MPEMRLNYEVLYHALVRRLVEIADNSNATERMIDYNRVARAHEQGIKFRKLEADNRAGLGSQ
jgi:hypothetical protein